MCSTNPGGEGNQLAMFPTLDAKGAVVVPICLITLVNLSYCCFASDGHYTRYFAGSYVHDIFIKALKRGVRLLGKSRSQNS